MHANATLLTSRRPRALRRRARNSVLVFDLFADLLSGPPVLETSEEKGVVLGPPWEAKIDEKCDFFEK